MSNNFTLVSPGVQITEVDQSILPAETDAEGPIIIGRFKKGPAMKPVKVKSIDSLVAAFGAPVPGGSSFTGDVWRDGANSTAPTYAAYAAQAWLASQTSPVTLVRLLGDNNPNATTNAGKAGWMLNTSVPSEISSSNSTAYGLFVIDESNVGKATTEEIKAHSTRTNSSQHDGATMTLARGATGGKKVDFKFSNATAGTAVVTNATSTPPEITIGVKDATTDDTTSLNAAMSALADGFELAISRGFVDGLAVSFNSGSNDSKGGVSLTNLSTTETIRVDISHNNQFSLGGVNITQGTNSGESIIVASQGLGSEGVLAAVFYCDKGYMALGGQKAGTSTTVMSASTLVKSVATNEFKMHIWNATNGDHSNPTETIDFNFDRNSNKYIRNRFNTTPYKTNSSVMNNAASVKNYWLGESFERALEDAVSSTGAGNQLAILMPLHKSDVAAASGNWSYNKGPMAFAKTGYFIDYNKNSYSGFSAQEQEKLFRFCCLHEGEQVQKEIMIAIEDLKTPVNPISYNYGTFTVKIISTDGTVLESYANVSLDKNSPDYISRRIGDKYLKWQDSVSATLTRGWKEYGNYENVSDYIRVEIFDESESLEGKLPVGFLGPGRPRGFALLSGANKIKKLDFSDDFSGAFVTGSKAVPFGSPKAADLGTGFTTAKFKFPAIPLRASGSDGFSANPYRVHFGVRPKINKDSLIHDNDYCDYVRPLPVTYAANQFVPTSDFEYSFVFTLDDIRIDNNVVTWDSGSHAAGTSYTAISGTIQPLFDLGVKQFVAPLFGGFDGLDIKQIEPFANSEIGTTLNEIGNYRQYTINKAITSISDPENAPGNLLVAPGFTKSLVVNQIVNTAATRKDMLAIIDLEGDYVSSYESTDSAETRRGTVGAAVSNLKNKSLDTSYAACYYPAVQIQDNLGSGQRIWVPSSVAALGAIGQSDSQADLWFAPAGFNRGGLGNLGGPSGPPVIQARQKLSSTDRDTLYENNINPIATFPNEGLVIFGQKTLQRTASALDRINVRRLMLFLKSEFTKISRGILFEPNTNAVFVSFLSQVEPLLSDVQNRFGLTEFRVVPVESDDNLDEGVLYVKILLKPTRAIEFVAIDFVITRSGAEFV